MSLAKDVTMWAAVHGYDVVLASFYDRQSDYNEVTVPYVSLSCTNTIAIHSGRLPVSRLMKCCLAKRDTLILKRLVKRLDKRFVHQGIEVVQHSVQSGLRSL